MTDLCVAARAAVRFYDWQERITNLQNAELRTLQSCGTPAPGTIAIGPRAELGRKRESGEIKLEQVAVIFMLVGGDDYVFIADENADLAQPLLQLRVRAKSWKK